jgi:hypothetical protein
VNDFTKCRRQGLWQADKMIDIMSGMLQRVLTPRNEQSIMSNKDKRMSLKDRHKKAEIVRKVIKVVEYGRSSPTARSRTPFLLSRKRAEDL